MDSVEAGAERAREMLWKASVARYNAERQEENRVAWCDYHRRLQALHQLLADEHGEELEKLEGNGHYEARAEEA